MVQQLSHAQSSGISMVLYATADMLARTEPGSLQAALLKDRLEQFIREDHLRRLLQDDAVKMERKASDTVKLTAADNVQAELLAGAFRGVVQEDAWDNLVLRGNVVIVASLQDDGMDIAEALVEEAFCRIAPARKAQAGVLVPKKTASHAKTVARAV